MEQKIKEIYEIIVARYKSISEIINGKIKAYNEAKTPTEAIQASSDLINLQGQKEAFTFTMLLFETSGIFDNTEDHTQNSKELKRQMETIYFIFEEIKKGLNRIEEQNKRGKE